MDIQSKEIRQDKQKECQTDKTQNINNLPKQTDIEEEGEIQQLLSGVNKSIKKFNGQGVVSSLSNGILSGQRTFYQKEQTDRKKFDDSWISTIESYFPSINRISRNIRSALRYDQEIIPIERAKRVTSESIRHLSSNTQHIQEISDSNEIIPKKILTDLSEIDYGIYENRFVMTLVFRLRDYCNERIKIIRKHLHAQKVTRLNAQSLFSLGETKYEVNFDVCSTRTIHQRKNDQHNQDVLAKAVRLQKLISNLISGPFIKEMKRYKQVNPPIVKTQIILKNPDFRNAYLLWVYLDKNFKLDFTEQSEVRNKRFNNEYKDEINTSVLTLLCTMLSKSESKNLTKEYDNPIIKEQNAKVITRLPDESANAPEAFIIQPQAMNEYYLTKMKQLYLSNFDGTLEPAVGGNDQLKQCLEDAINITNSLYESQFGYNADDDIFGRLAKSTDPQESLKEAYRRQRIATTVRRIKEQDYRRAVDLENKWNTQLVEKQESAIKHENDLSKQRIDDEIEKDAQKLDAAALKALKAKEAVKRKEIRKKLSELAAFRQKLADQLRDEIRRIKEQERKRLIKERLALKKLKEREKQKMLKNIEKETERAMTKIGKEITALESKSKAKSQKKPHQT